MLDKGHHEKLAQIANDAKITGMELHERIQTGSVTDFFNPLADFGAFDRAKLREYLGLQPEGLAIDCTNPPERYPGNFAERMQLFWHRDNETRLWDRMRVVRTTRGKLNAFLKGSEWPEIGVPANATLLNYLWHNQPLVPKPWQRFHTVFFPGTIYLPKLQWRDVQHRKPDDVGREICGFHYTKGFMTPTHYVEGSWSPVFCFQEGEPSFEFPDYYSVHVVVHI